MAQLWNFSFLGPKSVFFPSESLTMGIQGTFAKEIPKTLSMWPLCRASLTWQLQGLLCHSQSLGLTLHSQKGCSGGPAWSASSCEMVNWQHIKILQINYKVYVTIRVLLKHLGDVLK